MAQQDNYRLLIRKLDQFIRKYYINQMIRGVLYSVGLILFLFLVISTLEYYFYFNSGTRKLMFYSFLGASGIALTAWVLVPLMQYFRLGKVISHEQAADIIGQHFTNVKDKLLNILQLKNQADASDDRSLIVASINQKSEEIKPVPFKKAVDLSQNRKYLKYALPPLLLLLGILFINANLITDSTTRLLNNNVEFERPAPFHFKLAEENPSVVQFDDYPLTVKVEGDALPNEVFIDVDNYQYRLTKEDANTFTYRFSNVQKNTPFKLYSSGVNSKTYELEVLKKPNILNFDVELDYPGYIDRKDEKLANIGDLVVPEGTNIDWVFNTENTDNIAMQFSSAEESIESKRFSDELFTYKKKAMQNESYKLYVSNKALPNADSVSYTLTVIPDKYPSINAQKFQDSTNTRLLFFAGEASDDYGLLNLSFNYRIKPAKGEQGEINTVKLQKPEGKQIQYDYNFDMNELELKPGDQVTYYFEVADNDAVNGSKTARTNMMIFSMPTIEEYEAQAEQNDQQVKDDLQKALEESRKLQEDMKKTREKVLQEKELDWQTRKELEKMLERQKELEKQIEKAKEAFDENLKNQSEFSETDERMQEKQQKLQEMFENVMSDEMKELMRQIEELLQEMEKDGALEMMEEMEFNDEQLEKELDRMLELFKQMELEHEMEQAIDKLQELAEEQEKLAEKTEELAEETDQPEEEDMQEKGENTEEEQTEAENEENAEQENSEQNNESEQQENSEEQNNAENQENTEEQNQSENAEQENQENSEQQESGQQEPQTPEEKQQQLEQEQEEINEAFKKIQEQMDQIEQKNQELENQKDLGDQEQQMQDIQQNLENSQQQLQQQQNKKASESQKNASQKMKQMAQQMAQQMQNMEMQQMQEDMESLQQLLENLVGLSFDQEDLIADFGEANINTPKYVELVQEQFKLQDDFRLVEDSLQALSKRVFQIESFVTEKVTEIKSNMETTVEDLEERKKAQAGEHQQRAMKNINDLALMLSEVMNQMQQQMSGMMAGKQQCSNPNQQGPGMPTDKISEGQQQLNEQMRQMKQALENGMPGKSEDFAKMAARQAALRKALKEKQKELQQQGQGSKELDELMEKMDKVEIDLVNKELKNETMERQQEILTRLLEHEKAERERGYENQRKSETAQETERKMPPSLEEYLKKREAEIDVYKTVSPSLKPYYRNLVENYFKSLTTE